MPTRFYRRSTADRDLCIERSIFEAEHGQARLAELRLADLADEFPSDPEIEFHRGWVAALFLGKGVQARERMLETRRLISAGKGARAETQWRTRFLAAMCALTCDEMRSLTTEALQCVPPGSPEREALSSRLAKCETDAAIGRELSSAAYQMAADGDQGLAAAYAELALVCGHVKSQERLALAVTRARCLRELDKQAESQHISRELQLASDERPWLLDAIHSIDIALEADPYSAENWNHRSSWCLLLGRYQEAIAAANKAIELRPEGYAFPHGNRGLAHLRLGDAANAEADFQRAEAEATKAADTVAQDWMAALRKSMAARTLLLTSSTKSVALAKGIVGFAGNYSAEEMTHCKSRMPRIAADFAARLQRGSGLKWRAAVLAEALSWFTAESCLWICRFASVQANANVTHQMAPVCLYLATHAAPPLSHDATRLFNLSLMGEIDMHGPAGRKFFEDYAATIQSVADGGAWRKVTEIVLHDLGSMQEHFPDWIRAVNSGIERDQQWRGVAKGWLDDLDGEIPVIRGIHRRGSGMPGCLIVAALVGLAGWFAFNAFVK